MGIRELLKYKTAETASVRHDNPPLDPWDQPSYVTLVARPISVHHNGHRKRSSFTFLAPSTHCLAPQQNSIENFVRPSKNRFMFQQFSYA